MKREENGKGRDDRTLHRFQNMDMPACCRDDRKCRKSPLTLRYDNADARH